jgi:hypothetical protein
MFNVTLLFGVNIEDEAREDFDEEVGRRIAAIIKAKMAAGTPLEEVLEKHINTVVRAR